MDNNTLIKALKTSLRTLNEIPNTKLHGEYKDSYSVCSHIEKIISRASLRRNGYLVLWSVDINADSPEEAAREALEIQRDSDSTATLFEVIETYTGKKTVIDLALDC